MLSDIVTDVLSHESGVETLPPLADRGQLLTAVREALPDIVIMGLSDDELPAECHGLFHAHPPVRLLGVAADGRRTFLYELRPYRIPLGELSPEGLAAAVREVGQRRAESSFVREPLDRMEGKDA